MAVVTPTDSLKSVSNRCVIEVLIVFLLLHCHMAVFNFPIVLGILSYG